MIESIQTVPLDSLILSATGAQSERRKRFDQAAIAELAESIKAVGLLQPIVVRPRSELDVEIFEIVAGERRFLAAQHAGLTEISVSVRDLTDEQVLEVQLVENLQREGLHELVEAEGYEALMKQHGYTVEDLVAKVGKSRGYVYGRLKLLALGPAARQAFFDGELNASTALLLARIPHADLQRKACGEICNGRYSNGPMSFREAAEFVHRTYMLRLADAEFSPKDASLVPAAGPCGTCPKRTGNQPELFADVKGADVCTDPKCFETKVAASRKRALEDAKASGRKIISGSEAKKLAPYGDHISGYVSLDDKCYDDPKHRTYRQLVGKEAAETAAVVQLPKSGRLVEVVSTSAAAKAVKDAGVKPPHSASDERYKRERQQERTKRDREQDFRTALLKALAEKAPAEVHRDELVALILGSVSAGEEVCELLGIETTGKGWDRHSKAIEAAVPKMSPKELARAVFVVALQPDVQMLNSKPERLLAAAKRLKVDAEKVRRELAAAEKSKAKKPTKTRKEK